MHRFRVVASAAAGAALFALAPRLGVAHAEAPSTAPPAPALSPSEFRPLKLVKTKQLTHDTKQLTFELGENQESGLHVASCLVVKADVDGKAVVRPYTPVSPAHQRGALDLIVKTYPEGKASKALYALEPGQSLDMKGPFSKFAYTPNQWDAVGMVAGGTGITPMYQLLLEILGNPRDRTEVRLIYASRTPADIILKAELDALAAAYPNFRVLYTVDATAAGERWEGAVGHVSREMVAAFLPPPAPEAGKVKVLVCGPPGFMKHLSGEKVSPSEQGPLTGLLADMKYTPEHVFKY